MSRITFFNIQNQSDFYQFDIYLLDFYQFDFYQFDFYLFDYYVCLTLPKKKWIIVGFLSDIRQMYGMIWVGRIELGIFILLFVTGKVKQLKVEQSVRSQEKMFCCFFFAMPKPKCNRQHTFWACCLSLQPSLGSRNVLRF